MRKLVFGMVIALPIWGMAADLPPSEMVARIVREAPLVRAAGGQLRAEEANRQRLEAGPHEWVTRLSGQQRRARELNADARYHEWQVGVERSLRLPGKAAADAEVGARGVAVAAVGVGEARHETARWLLKSWFVWLREQEAARQWQGQVELLQTQAKGVGRRQQLGDAAQVERLQAEAALAQASAQLAQAQVRQRVAEEALRRYFPTLALPADVRPGSPEPITGDLTQWVSAILQHDHELGVARAESQRHLALAARSDRERTPDPSVGLHVGRERSGDERIVGLTLSIPLPGEARRAGVAVSNAQAEAAAAREAAVLQRVEAEAAALYQGAIAGFQTWQQSQEAAVRLGTVADVIAKGYRLGEGNIADVLSTRRLANEAQLSERLARLDALEKRYRLLIDAHQLWDFDE